MEYGFLVLRSNWKNDGKPPLAVPIGFPLESRLGVLGGVVFGAAGKGGRVLVPSPLKRGSERRELDGSFGMPKKLFACASNKNVFWSSPKLAPPAMRS